MNTKHRIIHNFSGEGQCTIIENQNSPFVKFRKWFFQFRKYHPGDTPANRATIEGKAKEFGLVVKFNDVKK